MAVSAATVVIRFLSSDHFTNSPASLSPSWNIPRSSSLQLPMQLRLFHIGSKRFSSRSRPRMRPLVEANKQEFLSFDDMLANSDKPILVDFYATWCGPCQFMTPIINEVSTAMEDKIQLVKIDTEKYPSIADKYRIEALPTFIISRMESHVIALKGR